MRNPLASEGRFPAMPVRSFPPEFFTTVPCRGEISIFCTVKRFSSQRTSTGFLPKKSKAEKTAVLPEGL